MKKLSFGGYGISLANERIQFPVFTNPTKEIINEILIKTLEYTRGVIKISIVPEPETGIFELTVEYDSGIYLPLLSIYADDGDIDVKNWIENEEYDRKEVIIGGHYYSSKFTTKNVNIIRNLLINFIDDTNLLLSIMK
ncbi:hypothetical protein LVJ83_07055 [Uruburuella testudinis]|uniref:Uncharacterized protein n=1 Tax=Uruburuella testudinis TaxID=1282863 RepID=A0ABY4DNV8_9NEIS|nr:hypothetical protein [Uruburuella testudinis]UOO80748.1 hypothetical protein LVJ83_07055 [Uruburuella testudinis]